MCKMQIGKYAYCRKQYAPKLQQAYANPPTVSLLVLFANLTVVQYGNLSDEVLQILDYQRMGLFFNYDLLCYCFMAALFVNSPIIIPIAKPITPAKHTTADHFPICLSIGKIYHKKIISTTSYFSAF